MTETLHDLVTAIESEQAALRALLESDVHAEPQEEAEAMAVRQRALEPIMARLATATRRLTDVARSETLPQALLPKIEAWANELTVLLAALEERQRELAERRALVVETLQRLSQTSLGLTGYRSQRTPGARFVSGLA